MMITSIDANRKLLMLVPTIALLAFALVSTSPRAYASTTTTVGSGGVAFGCTDTDKSPSGANASANAGTNSMKVSATQSNGGSTIHANAYLFKAITLSAGQSIQINSVSARIDGSLADTANAGQTDIIVKGWLSQKDPSGASCFDTSTAESPFSDAMTVSATAQSRTTMGTTTIGNTFTSGSSSTVTPGAGTYYVLVNVFVDATSAASGTRTADFNSGSNGLTNVSITYTTTP